MYILLFLIFQVYKFESPLRNFNYTQNLNYFQKGQLNIPQNQNISRNFIPVHIQSLPVNNRQLYVAPQQILSKGISQNIILLKHVPEQQIHQKHISQQNIYHQPMYTQYMYNPQIPEQHIPQQNIHQQHMSEQQIHQQYMSQQNIYNQPMYTHYMYNPQIPGHHIPQKHINHQHMSGQQIHQQYMSQPSIYNQPTYTQYMYNAQIPDQHIPQQHIHRQHVPMQQIYEPYIEETENNTLKSQLRDQKYHFYKTTESDISQKLKRIRNMEKEKDKFPSTRHLNQGSVSIWLIGREFIQRFIDVVENMEYFMKIQNNNAEYIFIKCILYICLENPTYLYFKKNLLRKCCEGNQTIAISLCRIYTNQLALIRYEIWEIIRQKYKDI